MESGRSMLVNSGAPSSRSLLTSFVAHVVVLVLLMLIPAGALRTIARPEKPLDVVFYQPPRIEVPVPSVIPPARESAAAGPRVQHPGPAAPKPNVPAGPLAPGPENLPPGAEGPPAESPQQKIGKAGILAFRNKFASLAQDKPAPRLGADARYSDADDSGKPSSRSLLTTNNPGTSGGINVTALTRNLGGSGGGGGGGGGLRGFGGGGVGGGGGGLGIGRATSPIAPGGDRPLAHGGPGPSRTDEEIQI